MTTTLGVDLSHYDNPNVVAMFADGIQFMTHKAGGDALDGELGAWWQNVRGRSELLGTYWVLYPGRPAARADEFVATLDRECPGWRLREWILQVDCEIWNRDPATKPGVGDINAFCDRLVARMPLLRPMVYASKGQYGNSLAGLGFRLWNANYPSSAVGSPAALYARAGGDHGPGWVTYSGQMPAVWQFTSSATVGGQTTCDANAFRGTLDQLKALVAPGWVEDMTAAEFLAILKDPAVARQLGTNVWLQDNLIAAPGNPAPGTNPDGTPVNTHWAASSYVQNIYAAAVSARTYAGAAKDSGTAAVAALAALAARPDVDEVKLADDLAALLIPHLPDGQVDAASLAAAFRQLLTTAPA
jgi:GH25 family lysozyme M1 (1,4-beta-N-acetylmuramidase)